MLVKMHCIYDPEAVFNTSIGSQEANDSNKSALTPMQSLTFKLALPYELSTSLTVVFHNNGLHIIIFFFTQSIIGQCHHKGCQCYHCRS